MEKRDVMHRPHPEYRYWLYSPEGDGMTYYRTKEARDAAAEQAIGRYLEDGWADEVELVSAGEVTHFAQVLVKTMRPAAEDLDEGCDDDGMYWPEGMDWRGNYALEPLTPNRVSHEQERVLRMAAEARARAYSAEITRLENEVLHYKRIYAELQKENRELRGEMVLKLGSTGG